MATKPVVKSFTCCKCEELKLSKYFYRDKTRKSGYDPYCKECRRVLNTVWRAKNPKAYRALQRRKNLAATERRKRWARGRERTQKAKIRKRCSNRFHQEYYKGLIQREACVICKRGGKTRFRVEAHHDSYLKPFDVTWLCREHHAAWHRIFDPEYGD